MIDITIFPFHRETLTYKSLRSYYTHPFCGPARARYWFPLVPFPRKNAPIQSLAFSSLLTGRTAAHIGYPFPLPSGGGLDPEFNTVADEFKSRGYTTAFVGKWGVDFPPPHPHITKSMADEDTRIKLRRVNGLGSSNGFGPLERGFDSFVGFYESSHDHFTKHIESPFHSRGSFIDWHRHNETHILDYPNVDPEQGKHSSDVFTEEALRIIETTWTAERPSFLQLSYSAAHTPLQAPGKYLEGCSGIVNWRRRIFCGMVASIDNGVGRIVAQLRKQDLLENTLLVFASDNGGIPTGGGLNYPFRGQKLTVYEGGLRTPALLHYPARIPPGTYSHLFHVSDLAPTLLGLASSDGGRSQHPLLDSMGPINGFDHSELLLLLQNGTKSSGGPRTSVLEFSAPHGHSALVTESMKLILGRPGRSRRVLEPQGSWLTSTDAGVWATIEELICDVLLVNSDTVHGILGVGFKDIYLVETIADNVVSVVTGDPRSRHLQDILRQGSETGAVDINDSTLPSANWEAFDAGFTDMVQLYNLSGTSFSLYICPFILHQLNVYRLAILQSIHTKTIILQVQTVTWSMICWAQFGIN